MEIVKPDYGKQLTPKNGLEREKNGLMTPNLFTLLRNLLSYLQLTGNKTRQPQLKKAGISSTPASPGSAKSKGQSLEVIGVRLTPYVPGAKPALQPVRVSAGRKPLKRLSKSP